MSEASESREYVAGWLKQVPDFMSELGIRDSPDLASQLQYLGSGRGADVVFLGEDDGVKRVLKITMESAQGLMSQAALEDRPRGVVSTYEVVETDIAPRTLLPSLPKKGQKPVYVRKTWGIVQKFAVPIDNLYMLGDTLVAGEHPSALTQRFTDVRHALANQMPAQDEAAAAWLDSYKAALEWLEEVCEDIGSSYDPDLHIGNWGVDPQSGELVLLDLGQCYEIEVNANPDKESYSLYYKGGARAKKKIERIFESLGLTPASHFTRKEELEGETDPHYRKHARAKFFIELSDGEERKLEEALNESGVDWSFYF